MFAFITEIHLGNQLCFVLISYYLVNSLFANSYVFLSRDQEETNFLIGETIHVEFFSFYFLFLLLL
jgi:hypothetical protein